MQGPAVWRAPGVSRNSVAWEQCWSSAGAVPEQCRSSAPEWGAGQGYKGRAGPKGPRAQV